MLLLISLNCSFERKKINLKKLNKNDKHMFVYTIYLMKNSRAFSLTKVAVLFEKKNRAADNDRNCYTICISVEVIVCHAYTEEVHAE